MADRQSPTDSETSIHNALLESLDLLIHSASTAFSSSIYTDAVVNPGLDIAGYGPVPLPLTPRDAEAITRVCRRAPFGKGEETLVDTSVRRTWELDATQFETRNPAWKDTLGQFVSQAVDTMGVEGHVRAERYKLLLYEEGAFFRAHRDTEKVPGMFGTFVVCLPSKHEGGEVHLSHKGKKVVLDTAQGSAFGLSALAWFSDVTHEVKPVTSGYRLVITFNLVLDSSITVYSAGRLCSLQSRLQSVLERAQRDMECELLVYILQHKYTEAGRSLQGLKGSDRAIGERLQDACDAAGFFLFFAQMDYDAADVYDNDDTDDAEDSLLLSSVATSTGEHVFNSLKVYMDDILQADPFDRDADSREEEDYLGNQSTPARLRYHDSVIILMPKYKLPPLVPGILHYFPHCAAHCLKLLCQDIESHPEDSRQIKEVMAVVRQAIAPKDQKPSSRGLPLPMRYGLAKTNDILRKVVLEWTWRLSWKDLFQHALRSAVAESKGKVSEEVIRAVARSITSETSPPEIDWDERLQPLLPPSSTLEELHGFVEDLKSAIEGAELRESFQRWATSTRASRLIHRSTYTEQDSNFLVAMSTWEDEEFVISKLLPAISDRATPKCLQAILIKLHEEKQNHPNQKIATHLFAKLLRILQNKVLIDHGIFAEARGTNFSISFKAYKLPPQILDFIQLVFGAADLGFVKEAEAIINTHLEDWSMANAQSINFHRANATKFITEFMSRRIQLPDICNDMMAGKFAAVLLEGAISTIKRQLPQPPKDWSMPTKDCSRPSGCACASLNAFLRDPQAQQQGFSVNDTERRHLESMLEWRYTAYWTEKDRIPHTLMVRKSDKEYKTELKAWQRELTEFKAEIRGLQQPILEKLLGEKYDDLVRLKGLDEWETQLQAQPTIGAEGQALQPFAEAQLTLNPASLLQNPIALPKPEVQAVSAALSTVGGSDAVPSANSPSTPGALPAHPSNPPEALRGVKRKAEEELEMND